MRITQGTFSYLPDLTDEEIAAQIRYCLRNGWALSVEFTDDPHPRNTLWEMWGLPMFDLAEDDAGVAMLEVRACREALPDELRQGQRLRPLARAGRRPRCRSSSARPPDEPGSGWTARRAPTGRSATRSAPTRPSSRPGSRYRRRAGHVDGNGRARS